SKQFVLRDFSVTTNLVHLEFNKAFEGELPILIW
ncbi:MAG: hypothetical protein ACI9NN_000414, partial [Bacteroidia bacterium]